MASKYLTVSQYINYSLNKYPTLYASESFDISKAKILDSMFNTIGAGCDTQRDFSKHIKYLDRESQKYDNYPQNYTAGVRLFSGFTEIDHRRTFEYKNSDNQILKIEQPVANSGLSQLFTEAEKDLHPEVLLWLENKHYDFNPYPNFQKEYSPVWNIDLTRYDVSWTEEAIWFYERCVQYFNSDKCVHYHSAWPDDEKKQERLIRDYQQGFSRTVDPTSPIEEQHKAISEAYELEYNGDIEDFIKRRWSIEKARILDFCQETLDKLRSSPVLNKDASSNFTI